jgi:two-component system, NtrC family, sensor histidine kinase HydH
MTNRLSVGMVALGLCGAFGGLLGGTVITASIRRSIQHTEKQMWLTAEQLNEAANPNRKSETQDGKPKDALQQMNLSASAILTRLRQTERDALRAEQLAWVGQMAAGIAH